MAPKKNPKEQKQKQKKALDDKTFGLKNKNKSAKVQRYVQQMQQNANHQKKQEELQKQKQKEESKKALKQKKKEEFAELFKSVQVQQKVPFGVNPKTILCQYYKMGTCTKGKNCKFSHDAGVERKSAKIDLYTDKRAEGNSNDKGNDTMDQWDQAKLEQVISKKHAASKQPPTDIVCKYFLDAVESSKYGWFWQCPNGDGCKYKHALPPGFVLKTKEQKMLEKKAAEESVRSLEEWIEEQRTNMPSKLTPVTLESFNKWKTEKMAKEESAKSADEKKRQDAIKAGKLSGVSGRDLFTYQPNLFETGDDEEAWEGDYRQVDNSNEGSRSNLTTGDANEIDESAFLDEELDDLSIEEVDDA